MRIIERERVVALTAVPTIVRQIVESPRPAEHDVSGVVGVVGVATGAAPVPPDLIDAIATAFGCPVVPVNGEGLTGKVLERTLRATLEWTV